MAIGHLFVRIPRIGFRALGGSLRFLSGSNQEVNRKSNLWVVHEHLITPHVGYNQRFVSQFQGLAFKSGVNTTQKVLEALLKICVSRCWFSPCLSILEDIKINEVSAWNSVLSIQIYDEMYQKQIVFKRMLQRGFPKPRKFAVTQLIYSLNAECLDMCTLMHGYTFKMGLYCNHVRNNLVLCYARCGSLDDSEQVFNEMDNTNLDVHSWNALITCYATHGRGNDVFDAYSRMEISMVKPNGKTMYALLIGCDNSGLVDEGIQLFSSMYHTYGIEPTHLHFSKLIEAISRKGKFDQAEKLIGLADMFKNVDKDALWAILAAKYRFNQEYKLSILALSKISVWGEVHAKSLAIAYAELGCWSEAKEACEKGIAKTSPKRAGLSWVVK